MTKLVSAQILRDESDLPGVPPVSVGTFTLGVLEDDGFLSFIHPLNGVEWMSDPDDFRIVTDDPFLDEDADAIVTWLGLL